MTKLLVWIFLGEAALVALCVTIVAAWRSRRRRDRTFAAIAECLDRIAAQEGDRIAQHARFLQSAFHAGPDAAAEAARDLNTAKREFVRSLLTPLLTATPDFPTGLDESLNRFADGQLDIVARLMDRDSDDSDAAQAPPTQAPPAPRDTSALWEEETEPLQPAPPTPALPADAGLTAEAVIEGILPPLPAMDDSSDFFETPEPSDVAPSPTQEPAANGRTLFPSPSGTNLPGANLDSRRLALRDDSRDGVVKKVARRAG